MQQPRIAIVGASGYIGKFVVQASANRGFETYAILRKAKQESNFKAYFRHAKPIYCDVTDPNNVKNVFADFKPEVVICCLASRSGTKADSEKIDYQASLNTLKASQSVGAKHFILLSAFCVRKPLLEFQKAKLKFESSLINSGIRYSIVRPTGENNAFTKNVLKFEHSFF